MWSLRDLDGDESAGDGVHLMTLPTTSFRTMNATPFCCFKSSPACHVLCPASVVVSPNPVHLTSARPRMFHRQCFNSWESSCTFPQACREVTFHIPTAFPPFSSLMVAPVAHLSPVPWSLTVESAVVVDPGLDRSGMLFLYCVFIISFQWA